MLTLFAIPSATSSIDAIAPYATGWGTELLILAFMIIGILLAGMFARKIISVVISAAKKVLGGGRRGGRRGRR
jgi:hypothetical protein